MTGLTRLKHFQLHKPVLEGMKGNIFALSENKSGIFFLCSSQQQGP
jgi:hypothetical protein